MSVNGVGSIEGTSVAAGIERARFVGGAWLRLRALSETRLVSYPSDSGVTAMVEKPEEAKDEVTRMPKVSPGCRRFWYST